MRADEESTFVFVFRGAKRVNYGRSNTLPARPQPTLNSTKFAPSAPTRRLWGPRAALVPLQVFQVTNRSPGQEGGQPQPTRPSTPEAETNLQQYDGPPRTAEQVAA
jgi:hypothetical protein